MKKHLLILAAIVLLVACAPGAPPVQEAIVVTPQPTSRPAATPAPGATPRPSVAPAPTLVPTAAPTQTTNPSLYAGSLDLVAAQVPIGDCAQPSPFDLPVRGVAQLAFVPTEICANGELGQFAIGARTYIAVSGLGAAAFTIVDVTDAARPAIVGAWSWSPDAITYDLKPFRQGGRWYLALAMENQRNFYDSPCGIAIVEVTDPRAPVLLGRHDGTTVGSDIAWCNVHTTQVDVDAAGDGAFLLVSSRDTFDLRVLDIRDLAQVREINVYHLHAHPHGGYPDFAGSYVHDTTIVGDRVYVAYWTAGVMVLDRRQLVSGAEVVALNAPGSIAPQRFNAHHSFPTADGNFLFVEAEDRPDGLRLFDIRDLSQPREVLSITLEDPQSAPHNLLVEGDLLFVGWYRDGVQVFRYDTSDPERPAVERVAFQEVRERERANPYDGVWGVRVHPCQAGGRSTTCVYAADITLGLLVLELEER